MTNSSYSEQRFTERFTLPLSAVIKIKENKDIVWKETANLITVSRNGAGFYLSKKCQVGRLISLMVPMPKHLRCYDREKGLYRVWGLIQHCYPITSEGQVQYHVGVAFTGKFAPPEYNENPAQSYRLCGMNKDGLWKIVETQNSFVSRKHSRFWVSLDVSLKSSETEEKDSVIEEATTENISTKGASVFSDLDVKAGDTVRFKHRETDFSAEAIVRSCKASDDERRRLHLEFIDAEFPVKEIDLPLEEPEKN